SALEVFVGLLFVPISIESDQGPPIGHFCIVSRVLVGGRVPKLDGAIPPTGCQALAVATECQRVHSVFRPECKKELFRVSGPQLDGIVFADARQAVSFTVENYVLDYAPMPKERGKFLVRLEIP